MIICGLKFTHDGGIALIQDNILLYAAEMEKIGNNARHETLTSLDIVENVLAGQGLSMQDVGQFAVDGWGTMDNTADKPFKMWLSRNGNRQHIELASYGHLISRQDLLLPKEYRYPDIGFSYNSYMHVSGHIFGAYCTSPFIRQQQDAFILTWDGGMSPQLFYVNYRQQRIENLRTLFHINGNCYTAFAQQYPPFDTTEKYDLSVAGKVMAYIALGKKDDNIQVAFRKIYDELEGPGDFTTQLIYALVQWGKVNRCDPKDMIANFHFFISSLLITTLGTKLQRYPSYEKNLCFAGGCALNIKWNSDIRNANLVKNMWVPPFPNDSGSALGVACCEMIRHQGLTPLQWDIYCGPLPGNRDLPPGWERTACSLDRLAELLHLSNEPVIFLDGRAELGPRALGNRSILASPASADMKDRLNQVKRREAYRPVAPICMEEDALRLFDPGTPDPYMLYDHSIREEWRYRIPAVAHLDNTARLQTVNRQQNRTIYELLTAFKKISGLPVLCNTSANQLGRGFFPDVHSAMEWGNVHFIWCDGQLFYKRDYGIFLQKEKGGTVAATLSEEQIIIKF